MIFERLKKLFGEMLGSTEQLENIKEDSLLFQDLGFSSISMLYIAVAIEEEFKIELTNLDINNFSTVGDVCNYIEQAIAKK